MPDEIAQFSLEAQAVNIHLHIVRDLSGRGASAGALSTKELRFSLLVKSQPLTSFVKEPERRRFEVIAVSGGVIQRRLLRSEIFAESLFINFPHCCECCISHYVPPLVIEF